MSPHTWNYCFLDDEEERELKRALRLSRIDHSVIGGVPPRIVFARPHTALSKGLRPIQIKSVTIDYDPRRYGYVPTTVEEILTTFGARSPHPLDP